MQKEFDIETYFFSPQFFLDVIIAIPAFLIIYLIYLLIKRKILRIKSQRELHRELDYLAQGTLSLTVDDFFALKKEVSQNLKSNSSINMKGIYILHNERDDLYYVGQATRLAERVTNHFLGRGNGDVYADYKYGAEFTIKMIPLQATQFDTLNELERHYITYYDSFENGYNRTRGNRG